MQKYPQFSNAQYYKASAHLKLGNKETAIKLMEPAKENAQKGFTINDDNTAYERYPYQIRW